MNGLPQWVPSFADATLSIAFWAGAAVLLFSFLDLLLVIGLRVFYRRRERRERALMEVWRPVLAQSLVAIPERLPELKPGQIMPFLVLWNHYQESLRGESRERLNQLAHRLNAPRLALTLLGARGLRKRLAAILTLGNLAERAAWDDILPFLESAHPLVSLAAGRALIRMQPARGMALLAPLILKRADWPSSLVAVLLKEAGPEVISIPLAQAALNAPPEAAPRLVQYLKMARHDSAAPVIRHLLKESDSPEVIAACLRVLSDPKDLPMVRAQLARPEWFVRLQAAKALGRLGTKEDEPRLKALLEDPEWWVRYRAAQALAALPFVGVAGLTRIRESAPASAVAVLTHVIAEGGMA